MQAQATLIYDGDCAMCIRAVAWVRRRAREGVIEYLPCQSKDRADRFPRMPQSACLEAMQFVAPDGAVLSGERAFPPLLLMLPGWRWLGAILAAPPARWVSPFAYRFIARRRYAISSLLRHKDPVAVASCGTDGACE